VWPVILVPVREIQSGMRLAKSILLSGGRLFLARGLELRESYVTPLLEQGIAAVYIVNEMAPEITAADVISEEVRRAVTEELRQVMVQFHPATGQVPRHAGGPVSVTLEVQRLKAAVDALVNEVMTNHQVVYNLKDLRSTDDYTLGHSVNVCVLSSLLGAVTGLSTPELRDLALGALLHDIGKVATPAQVLGKPSKLTPEETAIMQRHTSDGWNILKEQRGIPYPAAIIALQHHERWGGGGYPEGLKEQQIFKYARLCAVADCFDAMTADRVYRPGMTHERALQTMEREMASYFEPDLVSAFISCVAPYPVGSLVVLSDGRRAVVVDVPRGNTSRPKVRVVTGEDGRQLPQDGQVDLDLAGYPQVQILELLSQGAGEFCADSLDR
jgi:HD-GYP domain-containing protein (c-di-GMP phosphodiesterase class II)